MQIRLLGPVELVDDGGDSVALSSEKERILLAALALTLNQTVSTGRLIDCIWGEEPPVTAKNSLQVHVSRLRKKLADASALETLTAAPGGYVLHVDQAGVDVALFEELVQSAVGEPLRVVSILRDALDLWRGQALADLPFDVLRPERARLEELRLLTLERRIDAELTLGRHSEVIAELEALVRADPMREGPRRQLMVALYRAGRQADALTSYREAETALAEELGVDPGPDLRALQVAILRQDPALEVPSLSEMVGLGRMGAPTGTVTLLMSDIEGSTQLWERHPVEMGTALRRHDELLRDAIEENCGYVVKTMGDAFHAAFRTPQEAAMAAIEIQQRVAAEPWPGPVELRVRIALHTGHCEERDGDYFGPAVNRVARLAAIGHGGQVLLSGTTAEFLEDAPEQSPALRDLGLHRLKDLERPERVFQIAAPGLEVEFPPLRSLDNPRLKHNLPVQLTGFVGREKEIAAVLALLDESHLVTLTGPGGSGKSRLAVQVAAQSLDTFGSVWLVELAPVADPELVVATVASALGVREEAGRPLKDTVITAISDRRLLIVLDNCEHLLDGSSGLTDLLVRSCPNLVVIATSREPLGLDGEQLYRVPSLSLPETDEPTNPQVAVVFDAVRLFVDRTKAHVPTFELEQSEISAVVAVCRRLDGMPLAIELAAARMPSLSVHDIEMRLNDRFDLLTKGRRNALPRQQSLRALIDWSYDALTSMEQTVLRRLSVFAGGWDLDASQHVCSLANPGQSDVLDVLASLVNKSLVQAEPIGSSVRYGLLETIRQYAAERLAEGDSEEQQLTRNTHATVYLRLAEEAARHLRGPAQISWFRRLDQEYDNIRVALSHLSDQGRNSDVVRISIALKEYWIRRGYFNEGLQILEDVLAKRDIEDQRLRAAALITTDRLGNEIRRGGWSKGMVVEGLEISRQLDDAFLMATALNQLCHAFGNEGDYVTAERFIDEAIDAASRIDNATVLGDTYLTRAGIPWRIDRPVARQDCLEAISIFSQAGDPYGLAGAELALAQLDMKDGDLDSSYEHLREVLRKARGSLDARLILTVLQSFGLVEILRGNISSARDSFAEGLTRAVEIGHRPVLLNHLIGMAGCASAAGDNERAAMLYGAASELLNQLETILFPDIDRLCEWDKKRLRGRMGDSEFADSYEAGRKLETSRVIQLALQ